MDDLTEHSIKALAEGIDFFLDANSLPEFVSQTIEKGNTVLSIVNKVRDKSIIKKLGKFLKEAGSITDKDRLDLLQKMNEDPKKFHEKVLLVLDRLDDDQKATMLGKLYRSLFALSIDSKAFHRLSLTIEKTYLEDLYFLHLRSQNKIVHTSLPSKATQELVEFELNDETKPLISNLINAGLLEIERVSLLQHNLDKSIVGHSPTALGKLLLTNGF